MTNTQEQSYRNLKTQYLLLKHLASLSTEDDTVPFSFGLYDIVQNAAKNTKNVANVAIKSAKKIANTSKNIAKIVLILKQLSELIKGEGKNAFYKTCLSNPLDCAKFIATTSSSGGNLALGCMQYPNFCDEAMKNVINELKKLNQNENAKELIEELNKKIKEMLPSDSHNPKSKSDG